MAIAAQIAKQLKLPEAKVASLLLRAPLLYKVYKIPKRSFGFRTIAQPTAELKALQRAFINSYQLPVHKAATAYQTGLSIKENALCHSRSNYLLKMDLNNFFNSITPQIFWQEWQHTYTLPETNEMKEIEHLLFWAPGRRLNSSLILSVGAPSSPAISNFIMYRFDELLSELCNKEQIKYTRYADDLTFSTRKPNTLHELPSEVSRLLNELFLDKISINKHKTVFSSKAHNRHITGICLTNDERLSLGRAKKRYLKHLVHQFTLGHLSAAQIRQLQGWLAHAKHIEPTFIQSLNRKYGTATLIKIREACDG